MGTTATTVNAGDPTFAAKLRVRLVSVIFLLKAQQQHIKRRHHSLLGLASNHLRRTPGRMDKDLRLRPKRAQHFPKLTLSYGGSQPGQCGMSICVVTNNCHFSYADGVSQPRNRSQSRERAPSAASSALSKPGHRTPSRSPSPPRTPSHVQWVPLSPQSSQTLLRHRATKSRENVDDETGAADDNDSAVVPAPRRFRKRRRNSDPSANRPVVGRHRNELPESDRSGSGSEDEVEVLPDRFDTSGRPIDPNAPSSSRNARVRGGWTERHGDFEYRSPRPGGTQARGMWSVGGTDPDQVERMMQDVTGIIGDGPPKGVSGWIGLAGRLLGSGILGAHGGLPGAHDEQHDHDEDSDGGGRRGGGGRSRDVGKVGYGGSGSEISRDERGKGRRRIDDHDDPDEVDEDDGMRRRRRRRKRREVE